jgi:hypothetical protein
MTDLAQALEEALAEIKRLQAKVTEMEMERDRNLFLRDLRDFGITMATPRMGTTPRWTGAQLHALRNAAHSILYGGSFEGRREEPAPVEQQKEPTPAEWGQPIKWGPLTITTVPGMTP